MDSTAVKIGTAVVADARKVAALRGQTLCDYLTERLAKLVAADLAKELARETQRTEAPGRTRKP